MIDGLIIRGRCRPGWQDRKVEAPDDAWTSDITYIPTEHGHAYLVAIMDWNTRAVLSWRLSNTLDTRFCLEAFDEAAAPTSPT